MDFLTTADMAAKLRTNRLNQITDNDPTILTSAESKAIAMVIDSTNQWYDINSELSKTGTDRNHTLVRLLTDITTYFIYDRIPDTQVPDRVIKNYDDAREDLKRIEDRKRPIALKKLEIDSVPKTKFRYGGEPRRSQNPF